MTSVGSYHSSLHAGLTSFSAYTTSLTTQCTPRAPLVPLWSLHTVLSWLSKMSHTYIQGLWECSTIIPCHSQFSSCPLFPDRFFLLVPQPLFYLSPAVLSPFSFFLSLIRYQPPEFNLVALLHLYIMVLWQPKKPHQIRLSERLEMLNIK